MIWLIIGLLIGCLACAFVSADSYEKGKKDGRDEGYTEGRDEGYTEGHNAGILAGKELGFFEAMAKRRRPFDIEVEGK